MISLLEGLRGELKAIGSEPEFALIVAAYNNEPSLKRYRNRKPRTDLMLRGLDRPTRYKNNGLIPHSAYRVLQTNQALSVSDFDSFAKEISYERYIDIGVHFGDWWQGSLYWELVVEIENNLHELNGTLNDLLLIQSHLKCAIFYSASPASAADALIRSVNSVFASFLDNGFEENQSTKYEILVLPERISENGLRGEKVLQLSFCREDWPSLPKSKIIIL